MSRATMSEPMSEADGFPLPPVDLGGGQTPAPLAATGGEQPAGQAPPAAPPPGGLLTPSFIGLLLTQFLGALNDNMFRWLIVPIGKEMVDESMHGTVVAFGAAMLVLPFIVFAAPAAYLADRFSKQKVIVGCKVLEIVVMLMGAGAILLGDMYLMFAVLFLMGAQSALFSPSKYGVIPEIVRPDRIPAANGMIGMTTIVAIVLGTVAGGYLWEWTKPLGQVQWPIWAGAIVGVATVGWLTSLMVRRLPAADPSRPFPWNPALETAHDLKSLVSTRPLFLAALGSAVFWSLGGLCQVNVDRIVTSNGDFGLGQKDVGLLLGLMAIGVGLGNVVAGLLSAGRIKLGMVPFAAGGIGAAAILLAFAPVAPEAHGYAFAAGCLVLLGLSAGMYDVPLQSFLQHRSPPQHRGSILAAANFLTFSGTLAASGVFMLFSGPMDLSGRTISLITGLGFLPVIFVAIYLIPAETTRFTCWLVTRCMYRVKIEGLENLPAEGGALIVSNHVSWVDAVLLGLAAPRDMRMVAYADYFEKPWLRWFGKVARIIPIRPGRRSVVEAIRTARDALRSGELVGIFPEGGITRTGEMQDFQPGFLAMLKDTDRPVVPVYLDGLWGSIFSFHGGKFFWKLPRRWPYPVTIRFGRPICEPQSVEEVQAAVAALRGEGQGKMQNAK